jgi:hypothetical protein
MRELLFFGIFVALSLVLQIFFLRVSKDYLGLHRDDLRFRKMVRLIYVNLGVYIILIIALFVHLFKT